MQPTLMPGIAKPEGWKKYFKVDMLRALGYCEKVLGLYNRIIENQSNPMIKKMVMGVIGRDTIGHWRDIEAIFMKFFGIKCVNCEDAIKKIAAGAPFETVVNKTSIHVISRWRLVEDVKTLALILSNILNRAKVLSVEELDSRASDLDNIVKQLTGNPLEILRFVKGFYSTTISLLPLYNEYTFFIYITQSMPNIVLDMFFPGLDMTMLEGYGLKYRRIALCNEPPYSILVPTDDSIFHHVKMYIDTVYRIVRMSIRNTIASFISIEDEEKKFIDTMMGEAKILEDRVSLPASKKLVNTLKRNSVSRRVSANTVYATSNILFYKDRSSVLIGSASISCKDFFEGITPYIITGLAHLRDIQEKEGGIVKARLHIYYRTTW